MTRMAECSEDWKSVRKVRYLVDIYTSLEFAIDNSDRIFSKEHFRKALAEGRIGRLQLIHKHYRSVLYTPTVEGRREDRVHLHVTLPDTLVFLRNIGILDVRNSKVVALPLSKEIAKTENPKEANFRIIEHLLDSKYPAYRCFLAQLSVQGSIKILRAFRRRANDLRLFLNDQGFRTDVASFYTIRDLFYELELVNWNIDTEGNELIYPTAVFSMDLEHDEEKWTFSSSRDSLRLCYLRKVSNAQFSKALQEAYLSVTKGRFGSEADLLSVRDYVCERLRISDQQFAELIRLVQVSGESPLKITLSFGSIWQKRRNYGLKIYTLPQVSSNRLASYIRIRRRNDA